MPVRIEFYGVPRHRAAVDAVDVEAEDVAGALEEVSVRLPRFAETCLVDGRLRDGLIANLNGREFTTDPTTLLSPGDSLLILSADAGG